MTIDDGHGPLDKKGVAVAMAQMRVLLMATGAFTLDQIDRYAYSFTRAIVSAYLDGREVPREPQ